MAFQNLFLFLLGEVVGWSLSTATLPLCLVFFISWQLFKKGSDTSLTLNHCCHYWDNCHSQSMCCDWSLFPLLVIFFLHSSAAESLNVLGRFYPAFLQLIKLLLSIRTLNLVFSFHNFAAKIIYLQPTCLSTKLCCLNELHRCCSFVFNPGTLFISNQLKLALI